MVIVCPECTTKFRINPERIPDSGSKVRCARCKTVFKAEKPVSTPSPEALWPDTAEQPDPSVAENASEERFSFGEPAENPEAPLQNTAGATSDKGFSYEQFRVEEEQTEQQSADESFAFSSEASTESEEQFTIAAEVAEPPKSEFTARAKKAAEDFSAETADAKAEVADTFTLTSPETDEPSTMSAPEKSAGKSSPLRMVLLLVLGALLLVGALVYLNGPEQVQQSLHQIFGQKNEQPIQVGQIALNNLQGSFISNQETGELFVIRGEALNQFSEPRASIQVKGVIFDAEGKPLLQKTIFAGNPISDEELRSVPYSKIEELMSNQFGQSLNNMNVNTGQTIPFAIVFRNLPKSLSEFSVDVTSSQPAAK